MVKIIQTKKFLELWDAIASPIEWSYRGIIILVVLFVVISNLEPTIINRISVAGLTVIGLIWFFNGIKQSGFFE